MRLLEAGGDIFFYHGLGSTPFLDLKARKPLDQLWIYAHNIRVKLKNLVPKPCVFVGSSRRDLSTLPDVVRVHMGLALFQAQCGDESAKAKALKGFGGRSVLEVVEDFDGDTFRAVYTVRFEQALYVLHVFQKKSKKGAETPKHEIDLIRQRLRDAEEHYRQHFNTGGRKP